MTDQEEGFKGPRASFPGEGRISVRFRNWNIALFALAFCVMTAAMAAAFHSIVGQVTARYAAGLAASSANALGAHIDREIALLAKAAGSDAVTGWLADEENDAKKALAYEEMLGALGQMYSNNLYTGVVKSRHEYRIDKDFTAQALRPFDTLDEDDPEDTWYFDCAESDEPYLLGVGMDHILGRKRVWLDYKIVRGGETLGILCTGLEFSHVARTLFANYGEGMRGLIVGADGVVRMDSARLEEAGEDEFTDPALLSAIRTRIGETGDNLGETAAPAVIELSSGSHRRAAIAHVQRTNWSAITLYNQSPPFRASLFLPAFGVMLALLLAFAFATHILGERLIFTPLARLIQSLARMKEDKDERLYGTDRADEFGHLASTILGLFAEANRDGLTGLYNRRFMERELRRVMEYHARAETSNLSVLMIDADYFKKFNDTYGHEEGDTCLKKLAQALSRGVTRVNDFVSRYGGEEFLVVLPNTDEEGAIVIAQRMLENVRALQIPHTGNAASEHVTVSIGVTSGIVTHSQSWEDYAKRADEAAYLSKQNGRNRYTYLDIP